MTLSNQNGHRQGHNPALLCSHHYNLKTHLRMAATWPLGMLLAILLLVANGAIAEEALPTSLLTVESGDEVHRFQVELAQTAEQRRRGLMFRRDLNPDAGMLFDFTPPREVAMWMRNTPLSLDMVFIGTDGVITKIHTIAVPYTDTTIPSGGVVRAVLEVRGGTTEALSIAPGDRVVHPIFQNGEGVD